MSLINNMLQDLEDRQAFLAAGANSVISDLQPSETIDTKQRSGNFRLFASFMIVITMLLLYIGYEMYRGSTVAEYLNRSWASQADKIAVDDRSAVSLADELVSGKSGKTSARQTLAAEAGSSGVNLKLTLLTSDWLATEPATLAIADSETMQIIPAADVAELTLKTITLLETETGVSIFIELTSQPDYKLFLLENPYRLLIEIDALNMPLQIVDEKYSNNLIARLRHTYRGDTGLLIFDLNEAVEINMSNAMKVGEGYELNLEIKPVNMTANLTLEYIESNPALVQVKSEQQQSDVITDQSIRKLTARSKAIEAGDALFNDAMVAYRAGDIIRTIDLLNRAVMESPMHIQARGLLVKVLLAQGDSKAAKKVLSTGLKHVAGNTVFIKQYAKLLIEDGQADRALHYLKQARPDVTVEPDYYALMAAILQRQENYTEAARLYLRLVQIDPTNSIWWMGLGISYEGYGRANDALQAYKRAQRDNNLAMDVAKFIQQRIRFLKG